MEDDEKEDFYIKDTDSLIVAGKVVWNSGYLGKIIF